MNLLNEKRQTAEKDVCCEKFDSVSNVYDQLLQTTIELEKNYRNNKRLFDTLKRDREEFNNTIQSSFQSTLKQLLQVRETLEKLTSQMEKLDENSKLNNECSLLLDKNLIEIFQNIINEYGEKAGSNKRNLEEDGNSLKNKITMKSEINDLSNISTKERICTHDKKDEESKIIDYHFTEFPKIDFQGNLSYLEKFATPFKESNELFKEKKGLINHLTKLSQSIIDFFNNYVGKPYIRTNFPKMIYMLPITQYTGNLRNIWNIPKKDSSDYQERNSNTIEPIDCIKSASKDKNIDNNSQSSQSYFELPQITSNPDPSDGRDNEYFDDRMSKSSENSETVDLIQINTFYNEDISISLYLEDSM
ncbi:DgyrCDS7697 [Dimorphilus gyrociliatus]|uniref:DgyrCDS7697 n=1 Tax=Dimorphilus gyrociliatus TaxID=2664684 RepID=A0A7I8VRU6_9ANNE|nr:DgyrCDS7697 [Dimorphilus gyrociliatus]